MKTAILEYQDTQIHYCQWGKGDALLIAFPGFGDTATRFAFLENVFGTSHTILAIDLPAHGENHWPKNDFSPQDFIQIIDLLLKENKKVRFELMGHSFGGRIILNIFTHFQPQLDQIYLVAPDGLSRDLKYSTYFPSFIRRFVSHCLRHPKGLLAVSSMLFRFRLLARHSHTFFQNQLKTPAQRQRLLVYWNSLAAFQIDLKQVKKTLLQSQLPVWLFLGKKDKIVPPQNGKRFSKDIPTIMVDYLEGGHFLLGKELAERLKAIRSNQIQ